MSMSSYGKPVLYNKLVEKGVLKPLQGVIEGDKMVNARHYVAPSGSGSLVENFMQEAEIEPKCSFHLSEVSVCPDTQKVKCSTKTGVSEEFDVVVLTMPIPQILQLTGSIQDCITSQPDVKDRLQSVTYSSRFCLGLFYKQQIDLPYSWTAKYFFDGPCIRFVSFDNRKRQQTNVSPSVLIHTSVPFSLQHVEEDVESVQSVIVNHLQGLMPQLPEPDAVIPHLWKYSQVFKGYDGHPGSIVLNQHPLVILAGDAFSQFPRFDGCLDSAEAVVGAVVQWSKQKSK
ncbi:renalase-like isoform X2 [Gigantopelta aegis]|uniref:renalase-like isoform X2 n=1 Tax=Gigantopelta aegis TaxID=1735272 RepID=UPI001B88B789|nr:renalase-like isoform X2 [Gigantopelta aegis]